MEKVNRFNRLNRRILLLSNMSVYVLTPNLSAFRAAQPSGGGGGRRGGLSSGKPDVRRRFNIASIRYISLSRLSSDVLLFHMDNQHDLLLRTPKRPELMFHLQVLYEQCTLGESGPLEYRFGERLYVSDPNNMVRDVHIKETQQQSLAGPGGAFGGVF